MTLNPGQRRTLVFVAGLLGAPLVFLAFYLAGWKAGFGLTLLLAYEGSTLLDTHLRNTISEILWFLAQRPLIPWLFGAATAWSVTAKVLTDPWLIGTAFFLNAHFFFQAQEVYRRYARLPEEP